MSSLNDRRAVHAYQDKQLVQVLSLRFCMAISYGIYPEGISRGPQRVQAFVLVVSIDLRLRVPNLSSLYLEWAPLQQCQLQELTDRGQLVLAVKVAQP